jgi:DNA anti-recombination protein RmuC
MAAKLSRRKYAVAVKGLNQIVNSPTTGVDKRLKAIELLLNLHERHDRMQERAEARERKAAGLPDEPVDEETTVEKAPEVSGADLERQRINQILGRA